MKRQKKNTGRISILGSTNVISHEWTNNDLKKEKEGEKNNPKITSDLEALAIHLSSDCHWLLFMFWS